MPWKKYMNVMAEKGNEPRYSIGFVTEADLHKHKTMRQWCHLEWGHPMQSILAQQPGSLVVREPEVMSWNVKTSRSHITSTNRF